jgi:hypothetical protein
VTDSQPFRASCNGLQNKQLPDPLGNCILLAEVCFTVNNLRTASPPSVYREVERAERVARQLACKTFDQMAGELKA